MAQLKKNERNLDTTQSAWYREAPVEIRQRSKRAVVLRGKRICVITNSTFGHVRVAACTNNYMTRHNSNRNCCWGLRRSRQLSRCGLSHFGC